MSFKRFGILPLVVAGALALPAVASAQPTIAVASAGVLGPQGASATVPVTYSCTTGNTAELYLSVAQSTGTRLAHADTYTSSGVVCDGTFHVTNVVVRVASDSTVPLKSGKAAVSAMLTERDSSGFTAGSVSVGPQPLVLKNK